ncbi:MAG TPA: DsbA family protein [Mycobacteriales bacterium]|nr:DsbA family protein [Mycobacteriales bacterium]
MALSFAVTWDYRCPFARNAHEHLLTGLEAGADWDVTFVPFSLGQAHVGEGDTDVWDEPGKDTGLLALQAGVVVRDLAPDAFLKVHRELFAVRHDHGKHIEDEAIVRDVLSTAGVDVDEVFRRIAEGSALEQVRKEHEAAVHDSHVWGVPTFIADGQAVFVRLMTRSPQGSEPKASIEAIERVVGLVTGWPDLNEFKHTSIPR